MVFSPICFAQTVKDLANRSLEELLNINVTSAARKPQSLRTTAAAAFVITAEDIRRSGIRLMPELLRLAPGVQVARLDSGNWAIAIRGFNSDFSNELLVLVDGQSVYNEEYGGIFWDAEQMPVEDIDRIEVIRGPGAAMWGANAVHGVINILTKSSADTLGGMISGEASAAGAPSGVARYGARIGSKATYRVTGYYTGERRLASSGYFLLPESGFNSENMSFRADWKPTERDALFVTARANRASDSRFVFDFTLLNPTPAPRFGKEDSFQGQLTSSWTRTLSDTSSITARFSFDHIDRNELFVPLTYNIEQFDFEHHWSAIPRNDLVWGLTYREAKYQVARSPSFQLPQLNWNLDIYAVFAADEITLVRDRLQFIAGVYAGHNAFTGMEYQPTGRLLWTPTNSLTTWAAVSRSIRTPSILDRGNNAVNFVFDIAPGLPGVFRNVGNPDYRSEPMISYELGQRAKVGQRLSLDGAAFVNSHQRELGYVAQNPAFVPPQNGVPAYVNFPTMPENVVYGMTFGAEVSATWDATRRWKLNGGYSWLRERMHWQPGFTGFTVDSDPSQQFQIRSQLNLPKNFEFDTTAYFYGNGTPVGVGRYLRGDIRLGWRRTENAEFNVGVRNALDPQHPEQFSIRYYQAFQVRRNVYASFTWYF
jgi:iron complex outermembrane receptor protein